MLIKFSEIVSKYGIPNGIIHIGAHLMEERGEYMKMGLDNIIWIEANTDVYSNIKFVNDIPNNERSFNITVSDKDNELYTFNIMNKTPSSSILKLDKHKIHHPHVYVEDTIQVKSIRMDTFLKENNINISNYSFLTIDIQGAELLALKGFGELLHHIKYIYTEVNTDTLYKDCALLYEIDEYLSTFGFNRVETLMTEFEWGDAFYIK
jgi:FkbM family methyltransferase